MDLPGERASGEDVAIRCISVIKRFRKMTGDEVPVTVKVMPDGHVQLIRAGEMRMRLRFGYR